jgi:hypothetical protein
MRRDFATFTKQASHENVAPRIWPDHPDCFLLPRAGINIYILSRSRIFYPVRANAIRSRRDKPTGRAASSGLFDAQAGGAVARSHSLHLKG